jgi:hypothetical protein
VTLRINAIHDTPSEALILTGRRRKPRALLQIERLPQNNWEPACGNGAIAKVLRSAGRAVLSSDIARYDGFEPDFVADYLTAPVPHGVQRQTQHFS